MTELDEMFLKSSIKTELLEIVFNLTSDPLFTEKVVIDSIKIIIDKHGL